MERDKRKFFCYWVINLIFFALIFAMDSMFPYAIDDINYASGYEGNCVSDVFDYAFRSITEFFFAWSGRMVGNFFAFLMVIIPKVCYNLINAVVFVLLGNVIYRYIMLTQKNMSYDHSETDPVMLLYIFLGLWIFTPQFGMVVIWTNASTIYHWVLVLLLLFMLPYWREYLKNIMHEAGATNEKKCSGIPAAFGMLILGVLGGNSMEPVAGTAFLVFIAYIIWKKIIKISFHTWEITGMIGFLIGFSILLFAPGQSARSEVVRGIIGEIPFYKEYAIRIVRETYYTCKFMAPLFGLALGLTVVSWMVNRNKSGAENVNEKNGNKKSDGVKTNDIVRMAWDYVCSEKNALMFVLFAILSIYAMTLSIAFAIRIFLNPTVFLIISVGISAKRVMYRAEIRSTVMPALKVLVFFITIFALTQYTTAMIEMIQTGEPFTKDTFYVSSEFSQGLLE